MVSSLVLSEPFALANTSDLTIFIASFVEYTED